MFQLPKLKYIKPHNTRLKFKSVLIKKIQYKHFFLAATSNFIYFNQIEACRKILRKKLGKKSKILIHVFTFTPYSFKPKETRMGRGKGNNFKWCKQVQSGKVLFNLLNVTLNTKLTNDIIKRVEDKLPLRIKFFKRKQNKIFLTQYFQKTVNDLIIY